MAATPRARAPNRKRSALREAAPCLLTLFAFVLPLALLICIKIAQFLGYWHVP